MILKIHRHILFLLNVRFYRSKEKKYKKYHSQLFVSFWASSYIIIFHTFLHILYGFQGVKHNKNGLITIWMEIIEVEKLLGILVLYSCYAFNQGDFLDFLRYF